MRSASDDVDGHRQDRAPGRHMRVRGCETSAGHAPRDGTAAACACELPEEPRARGAGRDDAGGCTALQDVALGCARPVKGLDELLESAVVVRAKVPFLPDLVVQDRGLRPPAERGNPT